MAIETLGNLASNLYSGLKLLPAKTSAFVNYPNSCIENVVEATKSIWKVTAGHMNAEISRYLSFHPNASLEEVNKYIMSDPSRVENMYQAKAYLEKCGVNPDSIATLSQKSMEVLAVPEFETALMILAGVTLGSVGFYKLMKRYGGNNLFYPK